MRAETELRMLALVEMIEDTGLELSEAEAELEFYAALDTAFGGAESAAKQPFATLEQPRDVVQRQVWLHEIVYVHRTNLAFYESRLKELQESR